MFQPVPEESRMDTVSVPTKVPVTVAVPIPPLIAMPLLEGTVCPAPLACTVKLATADAAKLSYWSLALTVTVEGEPHIPVVGADKTSFVGAPAANVRVIVDGTSMPVACGSERPTVTFCVRLLDIDLVAVPLENVIKPAPLTVGPTAVTISCRFSVTARLSNSSYAIMVTCNGASTVPVNVLADKDALKPGAGTN
jgi:hypothetical protein